MAAGESLAVTSAGVKVFIGDAMPATLDAVGYEAVDWEEIGEVTDIPEFGKTYNLVTHNPIADRKTFKRKGSYNNGNLSMTIAKAPTDGGQSRCIVALDNDNPQPFKIEYNDAPEGGTPTIDYFPGLVMSYTTNIGNVDSIMGSSLQVEIDGDILTVPAAES